MGDSVFGYDTGVDLPLINSIEGSDVLKALLAGGLGVAASPLFFGSPSLALLKPRSVLSRGMIGSALLWKLKNKSDRLSKASKGLLTINDEYADAVRNMRKPYLYRQFNKIRKALSDG